MLRRLISIPIWTVDEKCPDISTTYSYQQLWQFASSKNFSLTSWVLIYPCSARTSIMAVKWTLLSAPNSINVNCCTLFLKDNATATELVVDQCLLSSHKVHRSSVRMQSNRSTESFPVWCVWGKGVLSCEYIYFAVSNDSDVTTYSTEYDNEATWFYC